MVTCGRMDCLISCTAAGLVRCGQHCEYGNGRPAERWRVKGGSKPRGGNFGRWVKCREHRNQFRTRRSRVSATHRQRLDESAYVGPFSWNVSCTHTGEVPCGIGRFVLANASSIVLSRCWSSPLFFSPRSTVKVASNHINLFLTHNSTDCK